MFNKKNMKKGVSLVTVLMFMLVATIAATATYKWLTSEGVSSASRMHTVRAQQAARAGLTTAKSWMTFHGNETGAIISQFIANKKKPIHLNKVIKTADSSMVRDSMKYDVWLIGANTSKQPYSLKIASKGFDGDKGAFTEIGIFDVSGLYRVVVPQQNDEVSPSSFNKALFGQSDGITGSDYLESGIINGNFEGNNTPNIGNELLVTGDFGIQGGTGVGGSLYVGGNYKNQGGLYMGTTGRGSKNCKAGTDTNVVYVGGNLDNCAGNDFYVCGDLYVGGNIQPNCIITVTGNMTIGGEITRNNGGHGFSVGKFLIFEKNGSFVQQSDANENDFKVGKGILMAKSKMSGNVNNRTLNLDALWKYSTSDAVFNRTGTNRYEVKSGGKTHFFVNVNEADVIQDLNDLTDTNRTSMKKLASAGYWKNRQRMKKIGDQIDPSTKRVPDPVVLRDESVWTSNPMNGACGLPVNGSFKMDDGNIKKLNDCYARLSGSENQLYNGFLVIKWQNTELQDPTISLNGKFVLYVPNTLGQVRLPRTTTNSIVMLYLQRGAGMMQGDSRPTSDPFNYFIYSRGNISEINGINLHGSVVMADGSKLMKYQGGNTLQYDETVAMGPMEAGFIESNPEYERRAGGQTNNNNQQQHQAHQGEEIFDDAYIAVAPQLRITLRTEYKNNEFNPDTLKTQNRDTVKSSILVLPRVLYLPRNSRGQLTDYYDVINLNGAKEEKDSRNVSCDPVGIPTNGKLSANNTEMAEGVYTCMYQSRNYGDMPFYIVVSGNENDVADVMFEKPNYEINQGQSVVVKIKVENSDGNLKEVDVYQDDTPYGWSVSGPSAGTSLDGHSKHYKVRLSGSGKNYSVAAFTVTMSPGTVTSSGINFQLQLPCKGCKISSPDRASVFPQGSFNIVRRDVEEFCTKGHQEYCNRADVKAYLNAPSCEGILESENKNSSWVMANGNNCSVQTENEKWSCNTIFSNNVHLEMVSELNSSKCHAVIPSHADGNSIISVSGVGVTDTLYASLKRKAYNLKLSVEGATTTGSKAYVYYSRNGGADSTELGYCTIEKCYDSNKNVVTSFKTYAGDTLYFTARDAGGDKFKLWTKGDEEGVANSKWQVVVAEDNDITAKFNLVDAHCFYEDFAPDSAGTFGLPCSYVNTRRCIDVCNITPSAGKSCSFDESRLWGYSTAVNNPEWVMVYDNSCGSACSKGGGAIMPIIDGGRFIYAGSPNSYADNTNGPQAVILSTKENGANGVLTSAFMSDVVTSSPSFLNSGFIFRSNKNASEYYTVSVYGKSSGKAKAKDVYVGLCYVTTQAADKTKCTEKSMPVGAWGLSESEGFTDLTKINMVLNVRNDSVSVELKMDTKSIGDATQKIGFNLKEIFGGDYVHNDKFHTHSGFKLSNPSFRMFDISWISYDFGGKDCWDYPRLMCSFKSNYAGGIVPHNTFVKPWVAFSSFTSSEDFPGGSDRFKKCTQRFYYNGCDNEALYVSFYDPITYVLLLPYMCGDVFNIGKGPFWDLGRKMLSNSFVFTDDGPHGYYYVDKILPSVDGIMRNASVGLECPVSAGMPSSLAVPQSCGEFTVGDIKLCEKNLDFPITLADKECGLTFIKQTCKYTLLADPVAGANVRDAQIRLNIDNPKGGSIKISLYNDVLMVRTSKEFVTNQTGEISFDVADVLTSGFDPEHIFGLAIEVPAGKPIKVNSITSSCPNSVSAGTCSIVYNGNDWVMSTNVQNATRCAIGLPAISHADTSALKGSCSKTIQFPEKDLSALNSNNKVTYTFKLKAFREKIGNWAESDETSCSYTIAPVNISCSVASSSVNQGAGVPTLRYKFENCPPEGCTYSIVLDGDTVTGGPVGDGEYTQTFDKNSLGDRMLPGTKRFAISAGGKVNNSCSFDVIKYDESATASNCKFDPTTRKFTANVDYEGLNWYGSLDVVTPLGQTQNIKTYDKKTEKSISETISTSITGGGNKIRFTPDGISDKSVSCEVAITAPPIKFVSCPSTTIEVSKPGQSFKVSLSTSGCSDGKCSLSIDNGATVTPNSPFSGGEVTISDTYGKDTKSYKLKLSHEDAADAECTIKAHYKPQSELNVECGSLNKTDVVEKSQVTITPYTVLGCNGQCSYNITKNGGSVGSSSGYNGGSISFTDGNGTGTASYNLNITDGLGGAKDCPFSVSYKAMSATTLTTNFVKYGTGTYNVKTGDLGWGKSKLHCSVSSIKSSDRTVARINGCTIVIPGWNLQSNGNGCALNSNTTYTLEILSGVPSDLKCGLDW